MWTTSGILGLILMLLASAEKNGRKQPSLTPNTALRVAFNNSEMLQEVNSGSIYYSRRVITIFVKSLGPSVWVAKGVKRS